MHFAYYHQSVKRFFYDLGGMIETGQVTHWSEVPKGPK